MESLYVYLPGIMLAYAACFIGVMSPGPNVLAVMGTSMSIGRRQGIALASGVSAGSFVWAALTASGLSAVLSTYASAITVIKVAGGCYLLWLAYKAFRAAAQRHDVTAQTLDGDMKSTPQYFFRGLLIQLTNPKAILAWIAIMSLGLAANAPAWVAVAIVVGTSLISIAFHLIYAIAFSSQPMVALYSRARRKIQSALGAFFAFAGVKLLASES